MTVVEDRLERALAVNRQEQNRLRGKMFGAIEACGLPPKRERALKGLIRDISYDAQTHLESALRGEYPGDGT